MSQNTENLRPTWRLENETLPATYPASRLDPNEAMIGALDVEKRRLRRSDITKFIKAAASFHIQAAQDAYVEFALLLRDGAVKPFDGWTAELRDTSTSNVVNALLHHKDRPGAIHVSISVNKTMTDEARARYADLSVAINHEYAERGIDLKGRFLKKYFGKGGANTPSEDMQDVLEKDPASYRDVMSGDQLDRVTLHAIYRDGLMWGIDANNVETLEHRENDVMAGGYHPGKQITAKPTSRFSMADFYMTPTTMDVGDCAEILLPVLSGFLLENGLGDMVNEKSRSIGDMSWEAYDDPVLDEAAHAAVYQQGGLFNEDVLGAVKAFSCGLAEHDFRLFLPELLELSESLEAEGFTSQGALFSVNDGQDNAYVTHEDGNLCLCKMAENGTFRIEFAVNQTDGPDYIELTEVETGTPKLSARFARSENGWAQDFDGQLTGRKRIPYHIEKIKIFNDAIDSFGSLHCYLEEKMRLAREECGGPEI